MGEKKKFTIITVNLHQIFSEQVLYSCGHISGIAVQVQSCALTFVPVVIFCLHWCDMPGIIMFIIDVFLCLCITLHLFFTLAISY